MIHYSCDRCKRVLDERQDQRYVVRIEVQAALDPLTSNDPEDDRDHLSELEDLLSSVDLSDFDADQDLFQQRRYDLCQDCYRRYLQNPLGVEPVAHWGLSDN